MVETLRRFDPSSQRSTGATDHVLIVPVRERFDVDPDDGGTAEAGPCRYGNSCLRRRRCG
jgi:hypothetical protein